MARTKVDTNIQYDDERELYYVTLNVGNDVYGKRVRDVKTFSSKRDAIAYRNANKNRTRPKWQPATRKMTLGEYGEYFFGNCLSDKAESTVYTYKKMWDNHIMPALGKTLLHALSPMMINKYYRNIGKEKKLSENTVLKHHYLLGLMLRQAVREAVIDSFPLMAVVPPKKTLHEVECYTAEQLALLLEVSKVEKIYIAIMLGAHLGLRRSEICGLTWDKVDMVNRTLLIDTALVQSGGTMVIKETKSKRSTRSLAISDGLYVALINERKKYDGNKALLGDAFQDYGYVLCWEDGLPYRPNYVSDRFKFIVEKYNLPFTTLHGLRHAWVSVSIDEGVPLNIISRGAGHSTQAVTDTIYGHKLREVDDRPTTAVEQALKRARDKK